MARQYAADGWNVVATVRDLGNADELEALSGAIEIRTLDVADFGAIAAFSQTIGERAVNVLIANAGTWGPERIESPDEGEAWIEAFRVNSIAPVLLATALLDNVAAARGRLIALTSRMGSIADNGSGGSIPYRSSKAALNAAWKSLAIDSARRQVVAAVLHPGWVKTRMGGTAAPLPPADSVAGMRRLIADLSPRQSGGFFDHDGTPIPW
nr:SDR family oxidoreductase [Sphingosinicella sp. CPCC 101087]